MRDNRNESTTEVWAFGMRTNASLNEVLSGLGQMLGQMAAGALSSGSTQTGPQIRDHRPSAAQQTQDKAYPHPDDEVFGVDEVGGGDTGNARTQLGTSRRSGPAAIS